jgi:hypothetical protein
MKITGKKYGQNIKNSLLILLLSVFSSCQFLHTEKPKTPVAKVYDSYLYFEDIAPEIYQNKPVEDSLNALHQYIENWAYKTLLIKQAQHNVDTVQINKLVDKYKKDLLIETYKNLLIEKYLDTVVPVDTLQKYYEKYQFYFKAKKAYINPKYLVVSKNNPKISRLKKWFFNSKSDWQDSLIKNSSRYEKFDITGNNWYQIDDFKKEFPVFSHLNNRYILKKSKKFMLTDSLSLYLVFVKQIVSPGENLPLNFVKDDVKQLVLSKRKQNRLKKLEQDLKREAVKKKNFKIFKTINKNESN